MGSKMKSKNKSNDRSKISKPATSKIVVTPVQSTTPKMIPLNRTVISPLNYRKFYDEQTLEELAGDIGQHGIISPVTARPVKEGGYEIVVGERRFMAAKLAGLKEIPAVVKEMTDEQVEELQLSENMHREDPHPMHEAQGIGRMLKRELSVEDIAARLNRSKGFVYSRIRLLSLTQEIQDIFLAGKLTISEAFEIAALSAASQQEFFESCCKDWAKKDFRLYNISGILSQFKYDLKSAPFDTKDKKLLPETGACTTCSFNTATLRSLFPEYAKQAVCSNKECYGKKCQAHFVIQFTAAYLEHQPEAILFYGSLPGELMEAMEKVGTVAQLPQFSRFEVHTIERPEYPDQADYTYEGDDEPEVDEEEYNEAVEAYNTSLEEFDHLLQSGALRKGLMVSAAEVELVFFTTEKRNTTGGSRVTNKQVQEAIRAGTVTPELLQSAIDKINSAEVRARELDAEKVQVAVHTCFTEQIAVVGNIASLTEADNAAARFIIYESLDYAGKAEVCEALFGDLSAEDWKGAGLYDRLLQLTKPQLAYLVRKAMAGKSDSKVPGHSCGYLLYRMASSAGIDTEGIEKEQQQQAEKRQKRNAEKIDGLQKKIKKLNATTEAPEAAQVA
jgi:ParB family transcriptional regulator, chromosome partitioning protein